jgi:hypothetical protein
MRTLPAEPNRASRGLPLPKAVANFVPGRRQDYRGFVRLLWTATVPLLLACAAERPADPGPEPRTPWVVASSRWREPAPPIPTPAGSTSEPASELPLIYAKARFAWVHRKPNANSDWIGYLWTGGTARLKSRKRYFGPGCSGPYYEVEPRGFVCENQKTATLNADDPTVVALRKYAPDPERALPYRYGESLGLVRYRELPSAEIQRRNESDLARHLAEVNAAREGASVARLVGVDLTLPAEPPPALPRFARSVHLARSNIFLHSTVAYTTEALWDGRAFLLSADYGWLPKDRVKPYAPHDFHGVELGKDARLPLAFFRARDRPAYTRTPEGEFLPSGTSFRRLSWVELDGTSVEWRGERYLATRAGGTFVKESDSVLPAPLRVLPPGRPSRELYSTRVEVSISGGFLIALRDDEPVFTTLVSTGRGGAPVGKRPTLETASTPVGSYVINNKLVTGTMEAPTEFVHAEVPWIQNFIGPYSLHSAYWHDAFGEPVSAGCVNLSPRDARWLFGFSEPKLPQGWHAVRRGAREAGTEVVIYP